MNLVSEYGLTDDVIFAGDQQHVYPYLDACDIYVQPSRDDAFPHATLEAMAVGKPVVAFPEGVAREPYARDALVRVDEFSPEALADGVAKLIDSPGLRQKLGQAGLEVSKRISTLPKVCGVSKRFLLEHITIRRRVDIDCFASLLVELKALQKLSGIEEAQVINYLKASRLTKALMLNFASPRLDSRRLVFNLRPSASSADL